MLGYDLPAYRTLKPAAPVGIPDLLDLLCKPAGDLPVPLLEFRFQGGILFVSGFLPWIHPVRRGSLRHAVHLLLCPPYCVFPVILFQQKTLLSLTPQFLYPNIICFVDPVQCLDCLRTVEPAGGGEQRSQQSQDILFPP